MFRLIIVDDDDIIRNSMARNIPWAEWGFEVCGLFEDGQSAIAFLEKQGADVILTDVIMYEVSGIDLARWAYIHCPQCQVIILSGHKEFRFAQEAMTWGVRNYVIKPIDVEELKRVFIQVGESLERQHRPDTASIPIVYFGEEGFARIAEIEERIAQAVAGAETGAVGGLCERFAELISTASPKVLLHCFSDLMARIYEKINQAGISATAVLPRETLIQRLEHMRTENMIHEVVSLLGDLCTAVQVYSCTGSSVVEQIKRYIKVHLSEKITVDDIARSVYLSSGYLSRAFRLQCGESLMDYVIRLRMQRAAQLIKEGRHTIAEIASLSGYQDRAYFHRSFKKFMGCTVREYRARCVNCGGN